MRPGPRRPTTALPMFSRRGLTKKRRKQGGEHAAGTGSGPASSAATLGAAPAASSAGSASSSVAQAQNGLLQVQGAQASLSQSLSQAAINQAHAAYRAHASATG